MAMDLQSLRGGGQTQGRHHNLMSVRIRDVIKQVVGPTLFGTQSHPLNFRA